MLVVVVVVIVVVILVVAVVVVAAVRYGAVGCLSHPGALQAGLPSPRQSPAAKYAAERHSLAKLREAYQSQRAAAGAGAGTSSPPPRALALPGLSIAEVHEREEEDEEDCKESNGRDHTRNNEKQEQGVGPLRSATNTSGAPSISSISPQQQTRSVPMPSASVAAPTAAVKGPTGLSAGIGGTGGGGQFIPFGMQAPGKQQCATDPGD